MSVEIQTVEFERRDAYLSELDEGPPFTVHGVALGSGDVTVGQSGIKKLWPEEELRRAADSLEGRNLVVDHDNSSSGVVGEVTKAGFKDGVGVIYEAEMFEEDLAEKIDNGLLEVSIRGKHKDVEEMDETEDGAKVVEDIVFDNLSIVPTGAAPSNTIEIGEAEELSMAELSAFTDSLDSEELQEIEPGMWVEWSDGKGITIAMPEDGEVEVDVYEESDGKWRSTGETTTVDTDSLDEWDVDEEEDIGAREDDSEDEEENAVTSSDSPSQDAEPEHEPMDDDDAETAKHHHEVAMEVINEFLNSTDEDVDGMESPVSDLEEFTDDEDAQRAIDEFVEADGSMDATVGDFQSWLESVVGEEENDEEEMTDPEGSEKPITSDADKKENREQSPERFIDDDEEELQDYDMHTPDWSGTTESEWSSPDMEDFDTDDLSEIANHFLISATGFPPENFTDLKLPVVEPNGDLNVNALAAVKGGRGVSAVDGLGSEMEQEIVDWVNSTANEEFDKDWGDEEEAAMQRPRTVDDSGDEPGVAPSGPVDISLELINKYLRIEGNHERDNVDDMLSWMFGATDLPMETMEDFRSASNTFLSQTAGADSFSAMTVEQFRDWLLMHGDGSQGRREQEEKQRGELPPGKATPVNVLTGDDLRQGDKSEESELDETTTKVTNMTEDIEEKLAELSEPVAVEQSDLEELQQKADRFEEMSDTLDALKERTDILDEADREQVEELAEADEPVVVESARMEQLEEEAEQVAEAYAAKLAEESFLSAEELTEKFDIEELREKFEEQIGDPAEELASSEEAEPRSGDVEEEELEERAEEEQSSEEELEEQEEAEEMRAELKSKILNRN